MPGPLDEHRVFASYYILLFRLRRRRADEGWTLEQMADRLGHSHAYVHRKEGGLRMTVPELLQFAVVLGIALRDLFEPMSDDERATYDHFVANQQQLPGE